MTSDISAAPPPRATLWLAIWALALFTAALMLNTRHNDFPFFYHPDEGAKVAQIITGEWNFHHPMLLLSSTKAVVAGLHVPPREQDVVEAGRWISAGFISVAVVAFSLLGYLWRGWTAAFGAGLALLLHHQLYELAHYLKEDSALLMGLALTALTAYAFWQKPNAWRAVLLGVVVALAISGKYVGVSALALALPVLWLAPKDGRAALAGCFLAAALVTLGFVNLPLLLNLEGFRASFGREMDLVVHGQRGATRSVPHAQYWNIFRDNTTPVVWMFLLVFLTTRWRERRRVPRVAWLIIAFPFAYTLALSFSPKSNDRYFLPAAGIFTLLAALGAVDAARLLVRWIPLRVGLTGMVVLLVVAQLPKLFTYESAFQRDDNVALFEWIKEHLPPDAVIAKDSRIQLPDPRNQRDPVRFGPLPQEVRAGRFAADLGTLGELRVQGVTHVAVSESDYGRFFLRSLRPKKDEVETFARRKAFYEELLRGSAPIFERERSTVLYLHPGIRLYRLPPGD